MTESIARAERLAPPSGAPFFLWEAAGKPVRVRLPFDLIDRLEKEAVESFRSLSSRGSEIGGVLYGKFSGQDPYLVSIEEFELVPCDYGRGPLYRLTDADLARFDKLITQPNSKTVGFFRSHTRKGLALDADDVTVMESRFRDPHNIAMLIRPFATKASSAGIFVWESGIIHTEASYQEFSFRSSQLTPSKPIADPEPAPAPAATPSNQTPPPSSKAAARAQIVPIASRREAPTPEPPVAPEPVAKNRMPAEPAIPVETPAPAPAVTAKSAAPSAPAPSPAPNGKLAAAPVPQPAAKGKAAVSSAPAAPVEKTPETKTPEPKAAEVKTAEPKPAEAKIAEAKAGDPKTAEPKIAEPKVAEPKKLFEPKKAEPKAAAAKTAALKTEAAPVGKPAAASSMGKLTKISAGAAAALLLVVGLFVYPAVLRRKPAGAPASQDSSPLALRVERSAGEILLTWNRDSDAIRNASRAVLSITDGAQHEDVQLDLNQLRTGSIVYPPVSGDVTFKMEVQSQSGGKTVSESLRVLRNTRPSPLDATQQPPAAATPTPTTTPAPANGKPATPDTAAAPAANPETPTQEQENQTKTPERVTRPFRTETLAQRLRPPTPTEMPDAPTLGNANGGGAAAPSPLNNMTSIAPPPPAPAPAPKQPAVAATTPESKPQAGGQIVQAQLLNKKEPEYPKIARDSGAKGQVELIANVGADGKVKSVEVLRGHPMLKQPAKDAVMQWKYRPTMLNGTAVESQVKVVLNFVGDR